MKTIEQEVAVAIKQMFSDIDWDLFEEIDRSFNAELWHGPLPSEYWTEVDPLEKYVWKNCLEAEKDIVEILSDLPSEIYFDDCGCVYLRDPAMDIDNYNEYDEYMGPYDYFAADPRKILMFRETYSQTFPYSRF